MPGTKPSFAHSGQPSPYAEFENLSDERLQALPEWDSTLAFLTWDDSDGWYDHVMPPNVNHSLLPGIDQLFGKDGMCGSGVPLAGIQRRCGCGLRLPLLILSPLCQG